MRTRYLGALSTAVALLALGVPGLAFAAPGEQPLHRAGRWLVDAEGRVVVAHGVNVVKKVAPYVRTEFGEADARMLADEGFTTARIGFIWAGAEPKPGLYDDTYIDKVLALDDLLAKYGIRTMVDVHQDLWSEQTGGDGAPGWATLGQSFNDSFQHFWNDDPASDGVGIQTHFVRLWQHLASRLAGRANVMGIDPFNEPYPGQGYPCSPFTACPPFETGALAEFYRRVIPAVRAGGARQVIYPEAIADSGVVAPSLPGFDDPQTGFHYHYYCNVTQTSTKVSPASERTPEGEACKQAENESLGNYHRYTRGLGVPAFLGEFSCNDVNDDNAQVVDDVGAAFDSWTIWAYYTAADDPADCPGQGLLVDDKKPAVAKAAKLDAIVVPHAQAIAGTPESTSLDRATRTFKLSYRAAAVPGATLASDVTKVFVPQRMYPTGYRAKVTGATVISAPTAPWLLLRSEAPGGEVTLTLTPATGSTTGRPLQTGSACASRRRIAVHLRRPRGFVPRAAVVRIGTRTRRARVRSAGRGRLVVVVDLRGLPRATTRVRVRVRGARGRSVGTTRTYRPCTTNRLVPSARSQPVR